MPPCFNLGAKSVRCWLEGSKIGESGVSAAQLFTVHHHYTGSFANSGFKMNAVNAVSKHQLGYD